MVHQERRQILNFRNPPEYQQTIISDDVKGNKAVFCTSRQGSEFAKFFMIYESGSWKSDRLVYCSVGWKSTRKLF